MKRDFYFTNDSAAGNNGIASDGKYWTGYISRCRLNKSMTKLKVEINSEIGDYEYTLAANPRWGSYFQRFCEEFDLIDKNCKLEPSKLENRYVCFAVYVKPDGGEGVRWIEEVDEELVDLLLCHEEEAA